MPDTNLATKTLLEFEATIVNLTKTIDSFQESSLNAIPFPGSWTPAQVIDHIKLANNLMLELINNPGKESNRNPMAKVELYTSLFSGKEEAPDFILPSSKPINKAELLSKMADTNAAIIHSIKTADLSLITLDFEYPELGEVTRLELCHFIILHTQRHTQQLQNMLKIISR